MLDLEQEVRRVFDRQASSLSIPDGFDALVRSRIASRRRRARIAIAAAAVLVIAAAGAIVPRVFDGRHRNALVVTDGGPNASRVADVFGLDYREAQQRLQSLDARVLLSLDAGTGRPEGSVTRTAPAAGQFVAPGADLVIYVAWNKPGPGPGTTAPGTTAPGGGGGNGGAEVISSSLFPPGDLIVGFASTTPDPRCQLLDTASPITVRFLNGEVVGCMIGGFVWLDALDEAAKPFATMPDLRGLRFDDAMRKIAQLGITALDFSATGTSEDPRVLDMRPTPGEPITRLTRVSLTLDGPRRETGAPASTRGSSQIAGTLANGQSFVVREDPSHGLCVTLGAVDLGCDDAGPVVSPGVDASTPRRAVHFFSGNTDGFWLYYAYLHPKAVAVYLVLPDGTRWNVGAVSEPRYWAIPIPSPFTADEVERLRVVYVDATGAEFDAPKRS